MVKSSRRQRVAIALLLLSGAFVVLRQFRFTVDLGRSQKTQTKVLSSSSPRRDLLELPIRLQNRDVGKISRLCNHGNDTNLTDASSCWLMKPDQWHSCNNNGPKVIRSRSWMHPILSRYNLILFYGSHTPDDESKSIRALVSQDVETVGGSFHQISINVSFPNCQSIHSPSLLVNDREQKLFMYVHGHGCQGQRRQPTYLLTSTDGVTWKKSEGVATPNGLIFEDIFYLTAPVEFDGWFYAIGKTQEDGEGSAVLCRARSPSGPFERGPLLAKGARHCDLHLEGNMVFVFFTLIGDAPERILLATIELDGSVDWEEWRLLPGPTVLSPAFEFEHGNVMVQPSSLGPAECSAHAQLRDPSFLPDEKALVPTGHLSGTLFYTVQGERAFAASKVDIRLDDFLNATRYRDQRLISADILNASSLVGPSNARKITRNKSRTIAAPVLFTGSGRSGTTFVCKVFQSLGLKISHDNDVDCGPYPGSDGAASWYDAFLTTYKETTRLYYDELLIVRNPIEVVESRVHRMIRKGTKYAAWLRERVGEWEDTKQLDLLLEGKRNATDLALAFALRQWVRRNSFAQNVVSWVEQIEHFSSEPMAAWRLCMAARFGPRCPSLSHWRRALQSTANNINRDVNYVTKRRKVDWFHLLQLGPAEHMYVAIALKMSLDFGYEVPNELLHDHHYYGNISELRYQCGFDQNHKWDCWC